jgi:transcriptional regulator with XRE-family HTH domain
MLKQEDLRDYRPRVIVKPAKPEKYNGPRKRALITADIQTPDPLVRALFVELAKQDITCEELAHRLGSNGNTISQWRCGTTYPNARNLARIAALLGLELKLVKKGTDDVERR